MNIMPHKITREQSSEPLHQVLLNFGKGLWQRPVGIKGPIPSTIASDILLVEQADDSALQARVMELTVKQLVTTLRMQHEDSEDLVMLESLQSLVLAGEISFRDFIGRTQNLFPRAIEGLDVPLRLKINSLMI